MNDEIPSNQEVYYAPANRQEFALNMILFGIDTFMNSLHIKELDKLKNALPNFKTFQENQALSAFLRDLSRETIIDWTRVVICFENFMKASLLLNGYLIHKIDHTDLHVKNLSKKQTTRPISLIEYKSIYKYEIKSGDAHYSLKGILDQSITFTTLLRPKYQETINLPKSILETITRINKQRNELHFFHEVRNSYGAGLVRELEEMRDFVVNEMMGLYGHLEQVLKKHKK